jgi:hypothetical protein
MDPIVERYFAEVAAVKASIEARRAREMDQCEGKSARPIRIYYEDGEVESDFIFLPPLPFHASLTWVPINSLIYAFHHRLRSPIRAIAATMDALLVCLTYTETSSRSIGGCETNSNA